MANRLGSGFVAILPLLLGCPSNPCYHPAPTTSCPAECKSKESCYACCETKHGSAPTGSCKTGCDEAFQADDFEISEISCDPTIPCEDDYYDEIFAALPSYFNISDLQQFVCSLSADEQALLLADILDDPQGRLASLTEGAFNDYLADLNEEAEARMEALNQSGPCAYKIQFNAILRVLWSEYIHG